MREKGDIIVGTKPELRSESEEAKCVAEAKMRRLTKMQEHELYR